MDLIITTEKEKLDVEFIHLFIASSYWAKGRTLQEVQTCIDYSLNFGVYLNNRQIGYAHVVSDYVQFAYLMDVFIDGPQRGKGYSKQLIKYILGCDTLKSIKTWRLATSDAHALYAQFGFTPLANPEKLMELKR